MSHHLPPPDRFGVDAAVEHLSKVVAAVEEDLAMHDAAPVSHHYQTGEPVREGEVALYLRSILDIGLALIRVGLAEEHDQQEGTDTE